jgi:hypothetical protein
MLSIAPSEDGGSDLVTTFSTAAKPGAHHPIRQRSVQLYS